MARTLGSKNYKTREVDAIIDAAKLGPLEGLMAVIANDFDTLNVEPDEISLMLRIDAMKTLMKYRYSQKQALEISTPEPITVEVVRYLTDASKDRSSS